MSRASMQFLEPRRLFAFSFGAPEYVASESAGSIAFTIERSGDTSAPADVQFGVFGGPWYIDRATAGEDFTDVSATLTFEPGETSKTITVPLVNDTTAEGNEHLVVLFNSTSGEGVGFQNDTKLVVLDDDSPGVFALGADEYTVDEAAGQLLITVTRGGTLLGEVAVAYAVGAGGAVEAVDGIPSGRATLGADYAATAGTLTFAAGQTSAVITLPILDDTLVEGDERLSVLLSDPTGGATLASLSQAQSFISITDDDTAAVPGGVTIVRGADPADPMRSAIVATGTAGDDRFRFVGRRDGSVAAFLNGKPFGVFAASDRLVLDAGAGNDRVSLANLSLEAWLYGGDGDDVLAGTRADDFLVGGNGDDRLTGGPGRDLLLGGAGADRLAGGPGADALVATPTAYDTPSADHRYALNNVQSNWIGFSDYASRVMHITDPSLGPGFTPNSIADDAATDILTGASHVDVFFADSTGTSPDQVRGRSTGETVVEV